MSLPSISAATLFVVSGGARGITAKCVLALAQRYGCRFLLLGRSEAQPEPEWARGVAAAAELKERIAQHLLTPGRRPAPRQIQRLFDAIQASREIGRTLAEIATAGGQAEYIAVDVSDRQALGLVLEAAQARMGAANGLIHGAGALSDKPLARKSETDFDAVYDSKVRGLENLLACLPPDRLQYLVLFASAAGFFGNPGQADYALSNEILNRVAHRVRSDHPNCRVVSFNWGPWDAGMVTPELKKMFLERGVDVIPIRAGAEELVRALQDDSGPVHVLVGGRLATHPTETPSGCRTHRLRRRLSLVTNPALNDHVVGGHSVLPVVCAVSWMANAAEQLYPGYRFQRLDTFQVLKGIVFDDTLAASYTLELVERDCAEPVNVLDAVVYSQAAAGSPRRQHYRASVCLTKAKPEPVSFSDFDLRENERAIDGAQLYRDGTLFHGPAFQGIDRVLNGSESGLTVRCLRLAEPDEAAQGQFPIQTFNPYAADVHFQAMVVWSQLLRASAALPVSAERGEQFQPLPVGRPFYVTLRVRSASDYQLLSDTTAHDEHGNVYVRVMGAAVTLSTALNAKFLRAAS